MKRSDVRHPLVVKKGATMENVVSVIFDVEAEAYKAFSELRAKPFGEGYGIGEAALLKREGDAIVLIEALDSAAITSDDTAAGVIIGSFAGILGGPLGVLLGATTGALVGGTYDSMDATDSLSMLEVTAAKLFDGDTAIVALVQEDEPAFDAAFEGYETTIIRHFAVDVLDEVDLARQAEVDFANQLRGQLRAERKAERAEKRGERAAKIKAKFAELKAKHDERKAAFDEGREIAEAQFTTATKEMLGE